VKYLHRTQDSDGAELNMASFEEWVDFISSKIQDRLTRNYKLYTFGTHVLAFDVNCYQEVNRRMRLFVKKKAKSNSSLIKLIYNLSLSVYPYLDINHIEIGLD
jgi:hypothetical protein